VTPSPAFYASITRSGDDHLESFNHFINWQTENFADHFFPVTVISNMKTFSSLIIAVLLLVATMLLVASPSHATTTEEDQNDTTMLRANKKTSEQEGRARELQLEVNRLCKWRWHGVWWWGGAWFCENANGGNDCFHRPFKGRCMAGGLVGGGTNHTNFFRRPKVECECVCDTSSNPSNPSWDMP
jgi:hypothetical protein